MKVIFFGLGSIGQKHYQNLKTICKEKAIPLDVSAYRSRKADHVAPSEIRMIYKMDEIEDDYDVAFVTNPTALHLSTLQKIKDKAAYFFVEKPIFEKAYSIDEFIGNKDAYYVAAPLRYKGIMLELKHYLKHQITLNARVISSSYLPNWRKDDYTKSYSANPELGGGIELDCIHELDYVIDLFGFPTQSKAMYGKKSTLKIQSNDTALYLLEYEDKFIEIHLDYYGQVPQRKIEIITTDDFITCDLLTNTLTSRKLGELRALTEESNQMYLNELTYFIDKVLTHTENNNTIEHANNVLKIAKEIN
ncbi:Gfo/Idh/MocA family oxidoreductase [Carnobacterium sp. TMP28]|uniref:Gfo/Idh/MocA family oxidoreductase n=1 Tax=Carnobacterium sp. TMP28 TaxID=3397060 RepID=UPI0039E10CA8